jgi:prolyl oligopeptidase
MNAKQRTIMLATACALLAGCRERDKAGADATVRLTREPVDMPRLNYPQTATVAQTDDYHGTAVADPYRWLEDVDAPATRAWVEAQNRVTFDYLAGIPERDGFAARLTGLWDYARTSAPVREGGRTFFSRNDGLQAQAVLYVQDTPDGEPRVLLDPNTLSDDGTVALGGTGISRDGRYLAWSTSVSGSDWRVWYVRDIATGKDLPDKVEWSKFSDATWDHAAEGFFYSRYAAPREGETFEGANYFQKLYYHRLGTTQDRDVLVYERPEEKEWGFGGVVSDDGRYLVINISQGTSRNNRLYYKDLADKSKVVRPLFDAFDASYEFIGNNGTLFYIRTNKDAPRERIIAVDLADPSPATWREVVPEGPDPIDAVSLVNHSLVLTTMHDVASRVRIVGLDGAALGTIELPGLGAVTGFHGHPDDTETWYTFNSFLNPNEIYHYDFTTGQSTLFLKPEIRFDFAAYRTTQVFFESRDGTRVPMFLVHRNDLALDGSNPTILYGYGGFNIPLQPAFSIALLPWLEKGGIYAVANLRGGGEYGETWHEGGILKNKQNVFDDFIAAAEYLVAQGYTNPNRLAIHGGSNGGLLVGAVVNQRPELFGAAIPAVGVMDMLRFQEFTIGWAWTSDYGSSADPEMFPVLHAYSPYHNLRPGTHYPATMVMTADHDDRVVPGHSFKYAARLQACQAGNLPVLIRIQTKAGHGAGKPTAMVIAEAADRYAFLWRALGLDGETR